MGTEEHPHRAAPPRPRPWGGGWPLLAILALAVGLRVMAWHNAVQMTNDGPDFLWQARHLLAGDVRTALSHPYHPFYAAATAGIAFVLRDVLAAALVVSIAAGALIVLAVHALARLALPDRTDVAWSAALLAALHDRTLILTSDVTSDGLFLALFLLSLAMLFDAEQTRRFGRRNLVAGLLAGFAYLTRPEAVFLVAVVLLWLVLGVIRRTARRGQPLPRRRLYLGGAGMFLLGFVLVGGPYVGAMHAISGVWGLSLKPSMSAAGLGASGWATPRDAPIASPRVGGSGADDAPAAVQAPTAPAGGQALADWLRRVPPSLSESVRELLDAVRLDVLVLALLGLPLFVRRRRGLVAMLLLIAGGWVCVGTLQDVLSAYLSRRHMLAPALLFLPLAGAGLAWLWGGRRASGTPRLLGRLLVVLLLVQAGASGVRTRHTNHVPRVDALHWAAEQSAPGERIGVHRHKDGFYADRPVLVVSLPCHDARLLDAMRRHGVRLLVLDLERIESSAPHWLDGAPFEERARFGSGADTVVVLERRPDGA